MAVAVPGSAGAAAYSVLAPATAAPVPRALPPRVMALAVTPHTPMRVRLLTPLEQPDRIGER